MKQDVKVFVGLIRMQLLAGLEYKGWWIMCIQVLVVCVTDPLPTVLMFQRMGPIGEWSVERIMLVYALAVSSFGLAECVCRGFDVFPWQIQSGSFDRLLLRPRSLAWQVAGSAFHIHRLSRFASGLAVVVWMLARLGVPASPFAVAVIVMAILGGTLMYCGVFVLSSGVAFFTIKALDWIYILTNASYQVTRVPMEYMPKVMKYAFTFLLPVLFVGYYPAAAVCGWPGGEWGLVALPMGALFLALSVGVWRFGVRHYQSTGS